MGMPEEINRKLTDAISDLLFVTEESGIRNLRNEGVHDSKIFFVGNVMIDTLLKNLELIENNGFLPCNAIRDIVSKGTPYAVLTLHRPSNVDRREDLHPIWMAVKKISKNIPILFPVHPRTKSRIEDLGESSERIIMTEPIGYFDMLYAVKRSALVLTDSGGLQEETTALGIPCLTIRENTERPVTVDIGTNHLVGTNPETIISTAEMVLSGKGKKWEKPPLWDGHAAERIVDILLRQ
jgi:UDP-N-acetylglucosamine 2-epimerase (non-hydrolysing)